MSAATHQPRISYNVLVVDDDAEIRALLKAILERTWAFRPVAEADSANEALRVLERLDISVDVILLDQMMPHKLGSEIYPHLRVLAPKAKIIYVTVVPEQVEGLPGDGVIDKGLLPGDFVYALYKLLHPDTTYLKENF